MTRADRSVQANVEEVDVCVIGAGQSGLSLAFHLQRLNRRPPVGAGGAPDVPGEVSFVLLDAGSGPGGAWTQTWDSLTLFSPSGYSSLAGWPMPGWPGEGNPPASHVVDYLAAYEARYRVPVLRSVRVESVREARDGSGRLDVLADSGACWRARAVVSATGTWTRPFWPAVPGASTFRGTQLHAVGYRSAAALTGEAVLVVGGGNTGAQIAADLVLTSTKQITWSTRTPPRMLPDDVDGRALFEVATRAVQDRGRGLTHEGVRGLGDIVAVPSVRQARDSRGLRAVAMPKRLVPSGALWPDDTVSPFDTVIWCTGFRPALRHLHDLHLRSEDGRPATTTPIGPDPALLGAAAVAVDDPRVFFLGYGDWCAPASATLIGVNRPARDTAAAVASLVAQSSRRG